MSLIHNNNRWDVWQGVANIRIFECIRIFSDTNVRSYRIRIIFFMRIYSDICLYCFFDTNIFGYSFVSFFCYEYIRIFVPVEIFTNVTLCFALHVVLQCKAALSLHIFHTVSFALIYTSTFGGTTLIIVFLMQWFCSAVLLCNQQAVHHSLYWTVLHSALAVHTTA